MRSILLALAVLAVAALGTSTASAQSVGFFPSTIEMESALRGQVYETSTTLVNQTSEERVFSLKATGDTAEWTTFATPGEPDTPLEQITAPPESETRLIVRIQVPESAPNGDFNGVNEFDAYTAASFESRRGLVTGFQQIVKITVSGDQVIDLRVGDVSARNAEVGTPLPVHAQFSNHGNVDTAPILAMDFYAIPGDSSASPLDSVEQELAAVPPGQSRTLVAEWETSGREPGRYRADYEVLFDGERLALGSFEFELMPAGSLAGAGAITAIEIVRPLVPDAENRADITFQNDGDAELTARFEGFLFLSNERVAEANSPAPLVVPPGESVTLSAYFKLPPGEADYELRGRVFFDNGQSDEATEAFSVASPDEASITRWLAFGGIAVATAGAVLTGSAWALSRRKDSELH